MKDVLPKMIAKTPIEVFEHTEKSDEIGQFYKNSDLGDSSNQVISSPVKLGKHSSSLEETKQVPEDSVEHSEEEKFDKNEKVTRDLTLAFPA